MLEQPRLRDILTNDSQAATLLGVFVMALAMTLVMLLTEWLAGPVEGAHLPAFVALTVAAGAAWVGVSLYRVSYVRGVFAHGVSVLAQVVAARPFRANLRLKLRYVYQGQTHERQLDQVITGRTRALLDQAEVRLVIDQRDPRRVLLVDAYLQSR